MKCLTKVMKFDLPEPLCHQQQRTNLSHYEYLFSHDMT